jgi:hypothetical protein
MNRMSRMTRGAVIGSAVLRQAGGATALGAVWSAATSAPTPTAITRGHGSCCPLVARLAHCCGSAKSGPGVCIVHVAATRVIPAAGRTLCRGGNRCSGAAGVTPATSREAAGEAEHVQGGARPSTAQPVAHLLGRRRVSPKRHPG